MMGKKPKEVRDLYPAPWSVEIHGGMNRARVAAANGNQVLNGINIAKAKLIVAAINRDAAAPAMLTALKEALLLIEEITDLEGREGITDAAFAEQVINLAHAKSNQIRTAIAATGAAP